MEPERTQRIEKTTGYTLLIIGLFFILFPACLALVMFLKGTPIPQLVPILTISEDASARALAIFANVCMVFFILLIVVWVGSILTSRGVTMIKDVKLKLVGRSLKEAVSTTGKAEGV
jgi:hypothetical protein